MEKILIGHKEYSAIDEISENCLIVERKSKQYFLRKLHDEAKMQIYCAKRLSNSGINVPKVIKVDKKRQFLLTEFIHGENLTQILSQRDMSDEMYESLFINQYMAKRNSMTLDYLPENFIWNGKKLVYVALFYKKFDRSEDLADKYIRLYFNTHELSEYLKNNGILYDKTRIKDQYITNKQIVLTTCKFYR